MVLEVMKILTAEVKLREQTREMEQARPQLEAESFDRRTKELHSTQLSLADRTDEVIEKIRELPEGEQKFGREINQLSKASDAMGDAEVLLAKRQTGQPTIAAETEAIEWLLQARRSGKGGGGGGSNPGEGHRSGADIEASALAQLGNSKEKKSVVVERENVQATGKAGRELPDEYRYGLDRYFEALEKD